MTSSAEYNSLSRERDMRFDIRKDPLDKNAQIMRWYTHFSAYTRRQVCTKTAIQARIGSHWIGRMGRTHFGDSYCRARWVRVGYGTYFGERCGDLDTTRI